MCDLTYFTSLDKNCWPSSKPNSQRTKAPPSRSTSEDSGRCNERNIGNNPFTKEKLKANGLSAPKEGLPNSISVEVEHHTEHIKSANKNQSNSSTDDHLENNLTSRPGSPKEKEPDKSSAG